MGRIDRIESLNPILFILKILSSCQFDANNFYFVPLFLGGSSIRSP